MNIAQRIWREHQRLPRLLRLQWLALLAFGLAVLGGVLFTLPPGPLCDEGMVLFMEGGCDFGESNIFFYSKLGGLLALNIAFVIGWRRGALAPFERFMGARWHLEGSYLELEWGVGRRSVKSRSYFVVDGEPRLVSEGSWFWHPGEQAIKGVFTAIDMPVVFFDYTVRFEEDRMVSDLEAYDAAGKRTSYVETWELTDETHFRWELLQQTDEGLEELMSGVYAKEP